MKDNEKGIITYGMFAESLGDNTTQARIQGLSLQDPVLLIFNLVNVLSNSSLAKYKTRHFVFPCNTETHIKLIDFDPEKAEVLDVVSLDMNELVDMKVVDMLVVITETLYASYTREMKQSIKDDKNEAENTEKSQ